MSIALIVILCIVAAAVIAFFTYRGVRKHIVAKRVEAQTGVKIKRRTFKEWCAAHMPSKRRLIQVYATLLYNANIKGYISGKIYQSATTKYLCVPGLNCYSCPGAVGACPLGALQNALAESPTRAPFYVIGMIGLFGLICARTVCGFLCPVGLVQELLYKVRTPKLKKSRVTRVLSYFKYVLLVGLAVCIPIMFGLGNKAVPGFCKYICPAGTLGGAVLLLANPKNADMYSMLGSLFTWKFVVLIACIVASIFIFRFFCRFLCPLGAIYGFFNRIALLGVKVDKDKCTDCGLCVRECKMDIKRVGDHECINCGQCIPVCPTKAIRWKGSKIFLHKSAETETAPVTEKPVNLAAMAASASGAAEITTTVSAPAFTSSAPPIGANETPPSESAQAETRQEAQAEETPQSDKAEKKPKKKRNVSFWVQLTAWIAALLLVIGALVYYNFIDVPKPSVTNPPDENVGYHVGEIAPDFTVKLYGSDESFNLYEHRGKLTVINFWAVWCGPCVEEIPYFNELHEKMPEIEVIAIHGLITKPVPEFIASTWPNSTLTFAQDNMNGTDCLTFQLLGGTSLWPLTVIVDAEGKVVYNSTVSFKSYEQLRDLVNGFLE